nr:PIN domain-containing protein [Halobiforma haloterrestris]
MVRVSAVIFDDAVDLFERYDDQALSFTDATTVALCRRHGIDAVMSFDDDFDGIVERIDPESV